MMPDPHRESVIDGSTNEPLKFPLLARPPARPTTLRETADATKLHGPDLPPVREVEPDHVADVTIPSWR
jgi:hypothetical protein